MSTILNDINKAAIAYNEALVLAKRIYNRVPGSHNAYKWVEANQGFMSPMFNKALYLKNSDLEYYEFKNVWILSPNDEYKMVRQFARIEDYNVDAYGTIVNASYEPWLKVAIGTTQNMTVFTEIVPALRYAQLALENISATFFKEYKKFTGSLFPEFQGNQMEIKIIKSLLESAAMAFAEAGGLNGADTVGQLLFEMYKNDATVFLQMEDVNLVREGAYIDAIMVIAPPEYNQIKEFHYKKSEAELKTFQDNQNKSFAISLPNSDPYYVVHPKLVGGLRDIIRVYTDIKQRKLNESGPNLNIDQCPVYRARALILLNRIPTITSKEAAYSITFEMLTLIKNLKYNCDIYAGNVSDFVLQTISFPPLTLEVVSELRKKQFPNGIIVLIPDKTGQAIAIEVWTSDKPQSGTYKPDYGKNPFQTSNKNWAYIDTNTAMQQYKYISNILRQMIGG